MAKPWVRLVTGYWQGLLPELQYELGKMVCLGHHLHLSGGSNQIMAPSGDWSTPWEVNVAVEGYFDKNLKVMPLTTVQMRTMAVSACASHWKQVAGTLRRDCRTGASKPNPFRACPSENGERM